jgi:hypothetical protein
MLVRHAGASRFAYNQCLRLVADAFAAKRIDPDVKIPWSGFDLINAYNAWKCDEAAGRVFVAAPDGTIVKRVTGLAWRHEISAQVFEEAAADLGWALSEFTRAKSGNLKGRRVGFPKWKRKGRCRDSFRFRNKKGNGGASSIRVGEGHPRSVTLPTIGVVRVHDQTRRLRRLLRPVEHVDPDTGQLVVAPRAKSCPLPSIDTALAGMSASTCALPTSTRGAATNSALPTMMASSSGWTEAFTHSSSQPLQMGPRSAASRHPGHCVTGWSASALSGGPCRRQPHGQPPSGPRYRRRRLGRVGSPTRLQGGMVRS